MQQSGRITKTRFLAMAMLGVAAVALYWAIPRGDFRTSETEAAARSSDREARSTASKLYPTVEWAEDRHSHRPPVGREAYEVSETLLISPLLGFIETNANILRLSNDQKALLVESYLTYTKIRLRIEKDQLQVKSFDGAKLFLEIPPYPESGKALKQSFYDQLNADFTPEEVRRIDQVLASYFYERFKGYGISTQTFEVSRSNTNSDPYRVKWAAIPLKQLADPVIGWGGSEGQTTIGPNELLAGNYAVIHEAIVAHLK